MAVIKVFDTNGVKVLQCFDTLVDVPYLDEEKDITASEDSEAEE